MNYALLLMNYALILSKYYEEGRALLDLLLTHSEMVARKALNVAEVANLNIDRNFVYEAAMLHDVGIFKCNAPGIYCYGDQPYIRHGIIGADLLRKEGLDEAYARVCERHTGAGLTAKEIAETGLPLPHMDLLPETLEEKLICYADKFYSKSGDPREEKSLERVRKSMAKFGADSLDRFNALHSLFTPV